MVYAHKGEENERSRGLFHLTLRERFSMRFAYLSWPLCLRRGLLLVKGFGEMLKVRSVWLGSSCDLRHG